MENVTGESSPATTRLIEVLVVNDEEDTRVILHDYFSAHGFHVRGGHRGGSSGGAGRRVPRRDGARYSDAEGRPRPRALAARGSLGPAGVQEADMLARAPGVTFKKVVSDLYIHRMLNAIAEQLGRDITVHSGDRHHVPKGGARKSHHLEGRAADFHVAGLPDADAFAALMSVADRLPTFPDQRFNLIHHGPYTATEGEHLHLGHYSILEKSAAPWSLVFRVEGLTPTGKNQYPVVGHSRTKCFPAL
jgi:hypothetical protein